MRKKSGASAAKKLGRTKTAKNAKKAKKAKTSKNKMIAPEILELWSKSSMHTYDDDGASLDDRCEVRISGGSIAVSYRDERGHATYVGREHAPGHFRLDCPERNARATLHRFPEDDMLEGWWYEDRSTGMWRIQLIDEE